MELLKKCFPLSFGAKDIAGLIIKILIYLVVGIVAGVLLGVLSHIPVVNIVVGLVGGLVDLYCLAGIIITLLDYFKILK